MANPSNCCSSCGTPLTVNIPGSAGFNSYTTTTVAFVVPAVGAQVGVTVVNSDWMVVGSTVFIEGAGLFEVIATPSSTTATLEYLNVASNTQAGSNIPSASRVGPAGVATDGAPGQNAFTVTTADFVVPAISGSVAIAVGNSQWISIGQDVYVETAGYFNVTAKADSTHFTGTYMDVPGNTAATNNITAGASVSPAGAQPFTVPVPIAEGGSGAITKAAAQLAFGLGQNITQISSEVLAYDITNSYGLITGMTIAVPASSAGLYKVEARITVQYTGVTFGTSRVLSIRVRNTTSSTTLSETTRDTGIHTTFNFPDFDYVLPIKSATLAVADTLELQCFLDTVETAGSSVVVSASLSITPLALS